MEAELLQRRRDEAALASYNSYLQALHSQDLERDEAN